ncbi:hypothetical protein [Cellulomonas sp. Y8]|uniref:hypothetical protein n=1 Tax=Cellulomonas sp. Y8 TaxID=2591145 RepID=UPI003D75A0C2
MRSRKLFLTAALVAALAGCQADTPEAAEPTASRSAAPTLDAGDVVTETDDMLVDPKQREAVPTWSEDTRAQALAAATTAMTAWARPDLPYDAWWSGLRDHLTSGAREVVAMTDPANVPVTSFGPAQLPDEGDTAYVAWISFETNSGTWWVLAAWQDEGTWLVDRITQSREVAQ